MLAQPVQENSLGAFNQPISADRVYKAGRWVTVVMFVAVLALLLTLFYWLGARRVNNYFVSRGDTSYQAQQYDAAIGSYTWATRFDSRDAHSFLNRGYS